MKCPVCHNTQQVQVDTHSDGFAENLQECGNCGALWTCRKERSILLHGATETAATA